MAVFLTLTVLLSSIGALSFLTLPSLSSQVQSVAKRLPDAASQIQRWYFKVTQSESVSQILTGKQIDQKMGSRMDDLIESGIKGIIPAAVGIVGILTGVIFVFIISIFLVINPRTYIEVFRSIVPLDRELLFDELCRRLRNGLRHWVGGILIAMTLMGTCTGVGLGFAGIENWPLLAVLTFLGTFVPYIGAILSAIPGILIGLSQSPKHFVLASLVYLAVHVLEGYIVEPIVMRRAVELKPAVLLVGQTILFSVFGILGVIVAAPLLASLQIAIQFLYVERFLGKVNPQVKL